MNLLFAAVMLSTSVADADLEQDITDLMPTAADVASMVTGVDDRDTLVQQRVVLEQLKRILISIGSTRGIPSHFAPKERALLKSYDDAAAGVAKRGEAVFGGHVGFYVAWGEPAQAAKKDYQRRLLAALAPKLVPVFDERIKEAVSTDRGGETFVPLPQSLRASDPLPVTPDDAAAAKPAQAPPDRSVARVRKEYLRFLGLELGQPLNLPLCPESKTVVHAIARTCRTADVSDVGPDGQLSHPNPTLGPATMEGAARSMTALLGLLKQIEFTQTRPQWRGEIPIARTIRLGSGKCPNWLRVGFACSLYGITLGGQLRSIQVAVPSHGTDQMLNYLRATYRPAKRLEIDDSGHLDASVPGVHVEAKVADDGSTVITLETESFHRERGVP